MKRVYGYKRRHAAAGRRYQDGENAQQRSDPDKVINQEVFGNEDAGDGEVEMEVEISSRAASEVERQPEIPVVDDTDEDEVINTPDEVKEDTDEVAAPDPDPEKEEEDEKAEQQDQLLSDLSEEEGLDEAQDHKDLAPPVEDEVEEEEEDDTGDVPKHMTGFMGLDSMQMTDEEKEAQDEEDEELE